ncbi:MAG: TrmH family RNA methyltransferase [Bacilli bacterium]
MIIKSINNKIVKDLCKLNQKKYRFQTKEFLVEGKHLVDEALKNNIIKKIFIRENSNLYFENSYFVSKEVMKKISNLESPPEIIGLCKMNSSEEIIGNKIVILDNLQDPGNFGTIIRSASAFNIDTIIVSLNTVDIYSEKVIRASSGMFFNINIIKMDLESAIKKLKSKNISILGTKVDGGTDIKDFNKIDSFALIMGNEGAGVDKKLLDLCEKFVYINMHKKCESLNVGVACSIILHQIDRG